MTFARNAGFLRCGPVPQRHVEVADGDRSLRYMWHELSMKAFTLSPESKILVIALRRLGDVLLTTPLVRSLRRAWPHATIDALVFSDTAGILEGNPDLDAIVQMPPRPTHLQSLSLVAKLWRHYDLAISTQCGDRPTFFARVAGRKALGPVESTLNGRFKRALLDLNIPYVAGIHRVEEILRLADALGIARVSELVTPQPRKKETLLPGNYAVIHAAPMFRYKQWVTKGWQALATVLAKRGLTVVATGGPGEAERRYLDQVWRDVPVVRMDHRLTWPELSGLLAGAKIYIGPDTSVTHLAAASGCPTIAIYGPTDPRLWGPWPVGGLHTMWQAAGTMQNRGNVWLAQNPLPCLPCQAEGCERRLESYSACLDELPAAHIIAVVEKMLT
jgi:heptosyltransferase III